MSYQRAQRLRNVGLGTLISDRIVSGQGFGRSIRSSISDKTVASMTGLKEKFDPMNIGKAFGGRLGAYAVGKLTGRSQKDIDYFTGRVRARQIDSKMNPLVTKVSDGDQTKMKKNDGLADVMAKIYNLMKANVDTQKQNHEIEKNLAIDKQRQREEWHSELIQALTGVTGTKQTATKTTITKQDGGGIFQNLMTMIEDALKPIMQVINDLKTLLEPVFEFLKFLGKGVVQTLLRLGGFLLSPLGAALMTGVGLSAALLALLATDKNPEQTTQGIINAGATDGGMAEAIIDAANDTIQARKNNILLDANNRGVFKTSVFNFSGRAKEQNDYLKSIGFDGKTGLTKQERDLGFTDIDDKGVPIKTTTTKVAPVATPPSNVLGQESSTPSNLTINNTSGESANMVTETPASTATPAPPAPADTGTRVQSAISENNEMQLDANSAKNVLIDNSKTISAPGGEAPASIKMDGSAPVRIDDSTLQKIFGKLARPV